MSTSAPAPGAPSGRARSLRLGPSALLFACMLAAVGCDHDGTSDPAHAASAPDDLAALRTELAQAVERAPTDAAARLALARVTRRTGDLEQAAQQLRKAEELGLPREELRFERELFEAQAGNLRAVESDLRARLDASGDASGVTSAVARDVADADATLILEALAQGCTATFRYSQAVVWLNAWLARDPSSWQAHFRRAELYQHLKRQQPAIDDYEAVLALAPTHADAHLRLAEIYLLLGLFPKAREHFQRYAELKPEDPVGLLGVARCQHSLGEMDAATATVDDVFARFPKTPVGCLLRGQLFADLGESEKALQWLLEARALAPFEVNILLEVAKAYRAVGQPAEAEKNEKKAQRVEEDLRRLEQILEIVGLQPSNVELRYEAAQIMMRTGRGKEGARWLQSALQENPGHVPSHQLLAEYYAKTGDRRAEYHRRMAEQGGAAQTPEGKKP